VSPRPAPSPLDVAIAELRRHAGATLVLAATVARTFRTADPPRPLEHVEETVVVLQGIASELDDLLDAAASKATSS
jgi:hypothetical protein